MERGMQRMSKDYEFSSNETTFCNSFQFFMCRNRISDAHIPYEHTLS